MGLQARLTEIREASAKRRSPEKLKVMHEATQELRDSGILDRTIKVGDALPPFTLRNQHDVEVRSQDLLARGAVVLTVYRGHW